VADHSYRPPDAQVSDPATATPGLSLALAVPVGIVASLLTMWLGGFLLAMTNEELRAARSLTDAMRRMQVTGNAWEMIIAMRVAAGAVGAWCATWLSRRWLSASLWVAGVLAAAPAALGLALSGGLAWDPGFSFATFAGALPAGWLAAVLARRK
jgi:uncharacterized membrane protein YeaQ/YmgE (transglycosylase-associated protein family)